MGRQDLHDPVPKCRSVISGAFDEETRISRFTCPRGHSCIVYRRTPAVDAPRATASADIQQGSGSALNYLPSYAVSGYYSLPNPQRVEYASKEEAFNAARQMKRRGFRGIKVEENGRAIWGWDK